MTATGCDHVWVTKDQGTFCSSCGEKAATSGYAPRHLVPGTSTQVDVESEILRLSDRLEKGTDELARLLVAEASADVEFKRAHAQATLQSNEGTVAQRAADATLKTLDELLQRRISEALASAQKDLCHSLRAQLSALQTLAANIRAQV